jgi:hypothetical protein
MHDVWVLHEEQGMIRRLLTGRMVCGRLTHDSVAYGSRMRVHTHDTWILREEHGMVHILLTGHAVCVFRARR